MSIISHTNIILFGSLIPKEVQSTKTRAWLRLTKKLTDNRNLPQAKIYRNQLVLVQNIPKPYKGLVKELLILQNIKVYMQKLKK